MPTPTNPFSGFTPLQKALLYRVMQHYKNDVERVEGAVKHMENNIYKESVIENAGAQLTAIKEMQYQLVQVADTADLNLIHHVTDYIKKNLVTP
jgi:Mg2+ and Co2+ transporter CorA